MGGPDGTVLFPNNFAQELPDMTFSPRASTSAPDRFTSTDLSLCTSTPRTETGRDGGAQQDVPSDIQQEIRRLQEEDVLSRYDTTADVRASGYADPIWGDVFWRRRHRDAARPDPEIPVLESLQPTSILEVGGGYGRFTVKLLDLVDAPLSSGAVTTTEVNPLLNARRHEYARQHPVPHKAVWREIDISTGALQGADVDTAVVPMNTLSDVTERGFCRMLAATCAAVRPGGHVVVSLQPPQRRPLSETAAEAPLPVRSTWLPEPGRSPLSLTQCTFRLDRRMDHREMHHRQTGCASWVRYAVIRRYDGRHVETDRVILRSRYDRLSPDVVREHIRAAGLRIEQTLRHRISHVLVLKRPQRSS